MINMILFSKNDNNFKMNISKKINKFIYNLNIDLCDIYLYYDLN